MSAGAATKLLARSLRTLSQVPSRIAKPYAAWVTAELRRSVRAGVTPYGAAFTPLAASTVRRKGHGRPLIRSGSLAGSVRATPLGKSGVGLDAGPSYGRYHITGTGRMPARPYLPVNVLPAKWRAELAQLIDEAFGKGLAR